MPIRTISKTPSAYSYPLLIKNLLKPAQAYAPEQEIVYRNESRYNYRRFAKRVSKLANALGDIGVTSGNTVAVMDWDSHRYLECYFAVPMIGAILHTLNIRLSPEQLVYTINHAEDDVIIVHADFLPLLSAVRDQFKTEKKIVVIAQNSVVPETPLDVLGEYEALLSTQCSQYIFPDFDENAAATIFYTTGTTGLPKGVCFSHRQIVLHTYGFMSGLCSYRSYASVDSGDVYMPLTPMFHVHAWGMPYLFTMLGAKQVYPGKYEPGAILRLIEAEKVTFSHCVPTIMHMLLNDPTIDEVELAGWKVVIGGSAMPKGLCKEALARGINLFSAYGMSETCPLLTIANAKPYMLEWEAEKQIEVRCSTGMPVPHVDMEIIDPKGKPLPHDGKHTGEVVVRSPWLAQSYFKEPEKSEALWRDGWMHTGDVGYADNDGYLHITDRIKDVIKSGGEWISSLELEDIISRHEAVSEAAAIGVPDQKWGERPLVLVVIKPEFRDKVNGDALKVFFMEYVSKGVIPKFGVPNQIIIVDELAKTSVGKLNKKRLRKQYG
ncbi:fatty acid--CoA ligase [Desulfococcaceae bacterium HSG7]|nr:fatty acid--CoA ligase [Desulfococcaceae bacterium HSG7]